MTEKVGGVSGDGEGYYSATEVALDMVHPGPIDGCRECDAPNRECFGVWVGSLFFRHVGFFSVVYRMHTADREGERAGARKAGDESRQWVRVYLVAASCPCTVPRTIGS